MKRRDVLKRASALAGIGAIAGCTGGAGSPGGGGDDDTTDEDESTTTEEPTESSTTTDGAATAITGQSMTTVERACMSGSQSASVAWEDDAVVLTGKLKASDPCHDAVFGDVEFDAEAGELTAEVTLAAQDVDACQSCIGGIEYEGRVEFDGTAPTSVTVVGKTMGDETTLADESK